MTNTKRAGVILWGLGALGSRVVKAFGAGVDDLEIVGAVDHDRRLAGTTLAAAFPAAAAPEVPIHADLGSCLAGLSRPADVLYHMTESHVPTIQPQLEQAMTAGLNVISASEGMFHPGLRFNAVARALDACAIDSGVSVVGCGINPGFIFDSLVMVLGRVTTAVTGVTTSRVIDVTGTGLHDIDHVGFGLPPDEFEAKLATGRIVGHMSMPESIAAVGERFGLAVERIEESWQAHTSEQPIESGSDLGTIEPGHVIGISQHGRGLIGDQAAVVMSLLMFYGPERFGHEQVDDIVIEGTHRVHATLTPAAVSIQGAGLMIMNATHDVIAAPPGLRNVLDFSIGGRRRGGFELVVDPARPPLPGTTWLVRRWLRPSGSSPSSGSG